MSKSNNFGNMDNDHNDNNKKNLKKITINYKRGNQSLDFLALVPIYEEDGCNSTEIYLIDDQYGVVQNKASTVVKNIAEHHTHSLDAIKKKYKKLIGRKTKIPLPLNPYLILIPLKFRTPLGADDGALGYFSKLKIKDYRKHGKNNTMLIFESGLELEILQSPESVGLALSHARIVRNEYLKNLGIDYDF